MWNKKWRFHFKNKYKKIGLYVAITSVIALLILLSCVLVSRHKEKLREREQRIEQQHQELVQRLLGELDLTVNFLDVNEYSRPGIELKEVKGVVVHYTANPGTDALANRNYFNNLPKINKRKKQKTYASSHFVIGLDGEIIQCIPTEEMSYASNNRNKDTISIECCHPGKSGKFKTATYQSLLKLTTYLCVKYNLTEDAVIRHYDVTGKNCPKYFVEHESEWEKFRNRVGESMRTYYY